MVETNPLKLAKKKNTNSHKERKQSGLNKKDNQMKATRAKLSEESKMNNFVEHRWISLTQKRGDQTCIPSKY